MQAEKILQKMIHREIGSRVDVRAFINDVGGAYHGTLVERNGERILRNPKPVRYGMKKGVSDLIGYQRIIITPDMIGREIARFLAIEVKVEKRKPSPEQVNFIQAVERFGGISGIARSVEEAVEIIERNGL